MPRHPPPIVRIEVLSEDFVGNPAKPEVREFPTGDWYGTWKFDRAATTGSRHTITMNFAVSASPDGQLRGRATGRIEYTGTSQFNECTFTHEIQPAKFEMLVTGRRTTVPAQVDHLQLKFADPGVTETRHTRCIRGFSETEKGRFNDLGLLDPSFDLLSPSGRVVKADGSGPAGFTKQKWEIHQAKR